MVEMGSVSACQLVTMGLLPLILSSINGQEVGVYLKFRGMIIPNGSFVDLNDLMYTSPDYQCCMDLPSNANPRDEALLCVTDLMDCCDTPLAVRGDWYYPDGRRVEFNPGHSGHTFRANRGPHEQRNGQIFYGSVRLFRQYSTPPERGRFRCELPSATDPTVNLILYANIVNFRQSPSVIHPVAIYSSAGSTMYTAGETYSLTCSATLFDPIPLPPNVPSPAFEWFFGPNSNAPLPSGLISRGTFMSISNNPNSITYNSSLQFSPLSQSHAGNYTCRLGAASLINSSVLTVTAPPITVMVTANFNTPLMVGETGNTLTCNVFGVDRLIPTMAYQWTKNDGATSESVGTNSNILPLTFVGLSDAGDYTCHATVNSNLLSNRISMSSNRTVTIQIPDPQSVTFLSNSGNIVRNGSAVTMTCAVELDPSVMESELSLLLVDAQLFRDGTPLTLTGLTVIGTSFTYTTQLNSFGDSNVGNYTCRSTVRLRASPFLTGMGQLESSPIEIVIGIPSAQPLTPSNNTDGCNTRCVIEIAITVVVTTLIECLLAAPTIAALSALFWKRNQRKIETTAIHAQGKGAKEDVYEDPEEIAASTTTQKFELADCPAYVPTAYPDKLQPHTTTETQNSDCEF